MIIFYEEVICQNCGNKFDWKLQYTKKSNCIINYSLNKNVVNYDYDNSLGKLIIEIRCPNIVCNQRAFIEKNIENSRC